MHTPHTLNESPLQRTAARLCVLVTGLLTLGLASTVQAAVTCERDITANIVALDQPILFNRLGASNVNAAIFALERDVVDAAGVPLSIGGAAIPGLVQLRTDKRPRPLVLRVRRGDCLTVNLTNLLSPVANPIKPVVEGGDPLPNNDQFNVPIDEQVFDRHVSFHVSGMQLVDSITDDGSFVGQNLSSIAAQGGTASYRLYAEREGAFHVTSLGSVVGSDGNEGNTSNLLFGQVSVEPTGANIYRSQVTEEEMRLVSMDLVSTSPTCGARNLNAASQPVIDYEARYPTVNCDGINNSGADLGAAVWIAEGKAGLPVLNMIDNDQIVQSEIHAMIVGPNADGSFPPSTYPLESVGKRNPTLPNRLTPFREFASVFHDESAAAQAFPGFFVDDPVFNVVLAGVKDAFMINYGSGGIGSEIIANRLRVGPMHDCLTCAFEEFFLTSFTVGDPAQLVDVSANIGLEALRPGQTPAAGTTGPKATFVPYPEDPANIHHSYTGDFVKIRNTHHGKEQHVFHLHNHQWLYNPNDDNSNYLDAQGIGPGVGYTYEINYGGSGNRPKSAGDAIFHCHFYPHFAQGMWYHWRNHDVLETGTLLEASGSPTTFHATPWALGNGTPMLASVAGLTEAAPGARVRALPDAEVVVGAPIPAIVPLPGKAMPPLPGEVQLVPNPLTTTASIFNPTPPAADLDPVAPGIQVPVGSLASVVDRLTNPGYPFWIAGIEDTVGQRPPTPPLDMASAAQVAALNDAACQADPNCLWQNLDPAQADGWDGGLPRAALQGYAAGGDTELNIVSRLDFTKTVGEAKAVFFPEEGTDLEQLAMRFHSIRNHPSCLPDGTCDPSIDGTSITPVNFVLNGNLPAVGAPYHEPCMDDSGVRLEANVLGKFFGSTLTAMNDPAGMTVVGSSVFTADNPRIYKGANMQYDVVLNKAGYHYPQQRIIALWEDVVPVISKTKPDEPLVMRFNTFDCGVYHHTNLVPEYYELDDYQVRTPTDIIGQHIHLPKWDLTTADGAANGWNYEDGTLSPGSVRERIRALNCFATGDSGDPAHPCPAEIPVGGIGSHVAGTGSGGLIPPTTLAPHAHPFWANQAATLGGAFPELWEGTRVTQQRWFFDPVVNTEGVDRGLGIIFTHDHYGPSTHQQIGLYATVLAEPAGSRWVHNETGVQLGQGPDGGNPSGRIDGGPTSWQAVITPPGGGSTVNPPGQLEQYREFYFEYTDFQHAYEAGVYVGADQQGVPIGGPVGNNPALTGILDTGNADFSGLPGDAFRFAINPPNREQVTPVFPDLVLEAVAGLLPGCPAGGRPCPTAIDVQDPGMFSVNYRNEPVALRVFDPLAIGPDNKFGAQSDQRAGDLALAFETRSDRRLFVEGASFGSIDGNLIPGYVLNEMPVVGDNINGTLFPPHINAGGVNGGDPFTPMMRAFAGDLIRVKMQAGGDEEEHAANIHGVKWLYAGSGHGEARNSGWRGSQSGGISEQFTLKVPLVPLKGNVGRRLDYLYTMDASTDGWWSGMWGILRAYENRTQATDPLQGGGPLVELTNNPPPQTGLVQITNAAAFDGACPLFKPDGVTPTTVRAYDITAVLANDVLPGNPNVIIQDICPGAGPQICGGAGHVGVAPDPLGGTLVYNPRTDQIGGGVDDLGNPLPIHNGPIHDPTAILYVHTSDVVKDALGNPIGLKPNTPVEPLVLRAAAGDCIRVTLRNELPVQMPELPTYTSLLGANKRDRLGIEGSTTFQTNLLAPSNRVGLHAQMLAYDVSRADGTVVGENHTLAQVIGPNSAPATFEWYAGDLGFTRNGAGQWTLTATPVEFGVSNLAPADKIKHGMKSAVGQLIVEPLGSSWIEDGVNENPTVPVADPLRFAYAPGATRLEASVIKNGARIFRDLSVVLTKQQTQYYADSQPVEHLNGEGAGIPEDPQEATGMAINYQIDPLWFRLGILPNSPFGNDMTPSSFGNAVPPNVDGTQFDIYSNNRPHPPGSPEVGPIGEPSTPVFLARPGEPLRVRLGVPHGTNRGSTFSLHGHTWQRDPYVCPDDARNGLVGACLPTSVGSQAIGHNPQGFYQGAQESIWSTAHYDFVLASAGGAGGILGDYLFRDTGSFGNASGLWGIVRVENRPDADGDGIFDDVDNCINVANGPLAGPVNGLSQCDTDGDGIGNICDADFNGNGIVDPTDFTLLKSTLGSTLAPNQDLNCNGIVDPTDFTTIKALLGQPPGPSCCGV